AGIVTVARRDAGDKQQLPIARAATAIDKMLSDVQASLFRSAQEERDRGTLRDPGGYDELLEHLRDAGGFVVAPWCGRGECETRVKGDSSATIRCLPLDEETAQPGPCVCCGLPGVTTAVWAQAY